MKTKKEKRKKDFEGIYNNFLEQTFLEVEHLKGEIEKNEKLLQIHIDLEPLKIRKKVHQEWAIKEKDYQKKINQLKQELEKSKEKIEKYQSLI